MGIGSEKNISSARLIVTNLLRITATILITVVLYVYAPAQTVEQLKYYSERVSFGTLDVKRDALASLRRFESEAASRIAAQGLADESEIVRATAVNALVFLPKKEASALLVPLLQDRSPFIRRESAIALAEVADPDSAPALITAMNSDRDPEVRSAAAAALGKTGNPGAVAPLTSVLSKKPRKSRAFLRRSAARSIGQLAEAASKLDISVSTPESFLPDDYKTKRKIQSAGTDFGNAGQILQDVLSNPKEARDTRREAAFALGAIGDRSARNILQQLAAGDDYVLAEICREALIKLVDQ